MVHKGIIERREESAKIRGKPFPKDNVRGKPKTEILVNSGHKSSSKGGTLVQPILKSDEKLMEENKIAELPKLINQVINKELSKIIEPIKKENEEDKELELIESIDFFKGENKLSIRFSKRFNRMYRVQVFMNDEQEIRPVTYNGARTGLTFWEVLKKIMKK